jgi:hypothetical protein
MTTTGVLSGIRICYLLDCVWLMWFDRYAGLCSARHDGRLTGRFATAFALKALPKMRKINRLVPSPVQ